MPETTRKVWPAIEVWRWFPTQIESGLALYTTRHIKEWHQGSMSSRELLVLIEELPEASMFKQARDRTYRLLRQSNGKVMVYPQHGDLPEGPEWVGVQVVSEQIVDWTDERKLLARAAREVTLSRFDGHEERPDLTGLIEPLAVAAQKVDNQVVDQERAEIAARRAAMMDRLYANVPGGVVN